jgi:hypothetical protein
VRAVLVVRDILNGRGYEEVTRTPTTRRKAGTMKGLLPKLILVGVGVRGQKVV